jgi:lysophospholipase L1-like esterase
MLTLVLAGISASAAHTAVAFEFRDNDKVVYIGDSNTSTGPGGASVFDFVTQHSRIVETYGRLRFADLRFDFLNRAVPGLGTKGALDLIGRVLAEKPTALVSVLGGIDALQRDQRPRRLKRIYLRRVGEIVRRATAAGARVYLASYPVLSNDPNVGTGTPAFTALLEAIDEAASEIALANPGTVTHIDLFHTTKDLAGVAKGQEEDVSIWDAIHLNDLGNASTGYAMLQGLGVPLDDNCNSLQIKIPPTEPPKVCGTSVGPPSFNPVLRRLTYLKLDRALAPVTLPLTTRAAVISGIVPFHQINHNDLKVTGLDPGLWRIRADNRDLGTFTEQQLADGVNLATYRPNLLEAGGPWDAQAIAASALVRTTGLARLTPLYRWLPQRDPVVVSSAANRALARRAAQAQRVFDKLRKDLTRPVINQFSITAE